MGIYKRIEYLKLTGFLDNSMTEYGHAIPNPEPLYYIYKITSEYTGHIYYGCTKNLKNRMYAHFMSVMGILENREDTKPQELHKVMAKGIAERFEIAKAAHKGRKPLLIEKFARDGFSVFVICVTADKDAAYHMERYYIEKFINEENCMNQTVPTVRTAEQVKPNE